MPLEQPLGRRSGVFLSDGIGVIENGLPPLPDVITHESMVLIPIGYWVASESAVVVFFYFSEIPGLGVRPFVMEIPYYQEAGKWTFEARGEISGSGFPFDPVTQPEGVDELDGSHFVFGSLSRRQAKGKAPMWVATGCASREVRYVALVQEGSEDRRRLDSHFGTWVVCTQVREPFEVVAFDSSGQELSRLRYPHGPGGHSPRLPVNLAGHAIGRPIVLAHARAVPIGTAEDACTYVDADLRDRRARGMPAPGEAVDTKQLARLGLLRADEGCLINPRALFIPADAEGTVRAVALGPGCRVGAFSVICWSPRMATTAGCSRAPLSPDLKLTIAPFRAFSVF